MASVNQEIIGRIPVLEPTPELLRRFDDFASPILAQIANLEQQSQRAAAARDLLLPRLMSGEITV